MIGTYFRGRLGNNMYQYAYIRSVAERKSYDFCILEPNDQFDKIFPHLKIYEKKCLCNFITKYLNVCDFSDEFYNLNDNIFTSGFFQDYKYFKDSPVKEWFKIYLNESEQFLYDQILNKYNPKDYCYIYFRGTDFNDIKNNSYHVTPEWYKNAKITVNCEKFIVITDDIETAKKNIVAEDYISTNYKTDLKLLISSKKLIIPVMSSFGWWGAWLSDAKIIIAPINDEKCWVVNDRFIYK